ncbi:MAG: tryptophan synthase subunit beta [Bacteroidetes bacterium]|nr:tryptophan synthase subunit beta [Bacteroidota bacterium]
MNFNVSETGFYGEFGGAFIPELLVPNIDELKLAFKKLVNTHPFQSNFNKLLKEYVGRPTPLYYAQRLSAHYNTKIYLKREDLCHTGAHKINNAIGQILLANEMKKKRIIAETGAGQHGVAAATVCALMGLECIVYMGAVDMDRQAPNVKRMRMLGAEVRAVHSGTKTLKDATNEAIRDWINHPEDTYYLIGSVVGPHPYPEMVRLFQSVIGIEIKNQLFKSPDYILACVGGGSNAIGAFHAFLKDEKVKLIGVEAAGLGLESGKTAATLKLGRAGILHGSKSILMQSEDGQVVEPYSISAGLDYPGVGPVHAYLNDCGRVEYKNATDEEALASAYLLTRLEGIIPALESAHALAALEKIKPLEDDIVVVNLSGRGDKDMDVYHQRLDLIQD